MDHKQVMHIGFLMENGEEIWFNPSDLMRYELELGNEKMVLYGECFLSVKPIGFLDMGIHARANHTYNAFGVASEKTNFNRLIDGQDIVALLIRDEHDVDITYCCEDEMEISASLDLEGNLDVVIVHPNDVMDAPCDCGCECECCCEEGIEF